MKHNKINSVQKETDFKDLYKVKVKVKYIQGCQQFINKLLELGKDIYIVTNSSAERVEFILAKFPDLKRVTKIISKNEMTHPKPNPECYINVINT